ncbi:peptide/nickel transport system permease protein [Thermoanaerobacter thermohydrosulfuricus]|uniref:Binding-protein-dependent transport systems inner membrane component n=3 Tax=Thermoanaerobacter TaxID=1754 RepID=B0KCV5_THEP3|nr:MULTISPECIES: ABC transporter permease [Thermoanaerobacter]ABY95562.1 binding-protein-dependent transport systems inner membrane component [Thermoanaerobacter pseudethanolicus ATCC 33223]ADV80497.1 binding-protein-dependent transport systems inner membrane component [Thermoanaerobacter brockii subsp. finnii Ako-1]SDF41933.1 peptide/nickel transport system permease protein [Thermoanaerobacter thermohydrosulfuricus]HBW60349.1 ABC transporter permease [Thermoanaerobacter sp.]
MKEFIYFAFKNTKFKIGLTILLFFLILAIIGPYISYYKDPLEYVSMSNLPPSRENWLGTTTFGQDVFTQFVYGLRSTFFIGLFGGGLATIIGLLIGFIAGYKGGLLDDLLMMLTNILIVIPTLALLIIIAAYLPYRGIGIQSVIIGLTAWPWTARAIRAQTLSLKSREFVNLAKITALRPLKIVLEEIAPNMMSYVVMVFILQFAGAILAAVGLDFIGLGPTRGISLGLMMQYSVLWNAIQLGMWWWFVPPGLAITMIVSSLYFLNIGLDEIFNPRLREE